MGCTASSATHSSTPSKVEKAGRIRVNLDKNAKAVYDMIKDIRVMKALPDSFKRDIAKKVKSEWFKAGQVIMKQGEQGATFYLIAEGACTVFTDGKLVSTLRSGDYMGEQALIKTIERTATVKAMRPTRCFTMDNETFQNMTRSANLTFFDRQNSVRIERHALSLSDEIDVNEEEENMPTVDDETVQWLCDCVSGNVLFKGHERDAVANIVQKMIKVKVAAKTEIIKQGDSEKADEFYVIESGQCEVIKDGEQIDTVSNGAAFGELALVFNNPRSATVRSTSECTLWMLTRKYYKRVVRKLAKEQDGEKVEGLARIPLLATLTQADLCLFSSTLQRKQFTRGHVFFSQGDPGTHFYLISSGMVSGVAVSESDSSEKHFELHSGEFFGELALRRNQPRSATVMASTDVVCFVADAGSFARLFGGFDNAMERQVEEYQKAVQSDKNYRTDFLMKRNLSDFEQGPIVGRGKYRLVQFVKDPHSGVVYALKSVKKAWVHAPNLKQTQRRIGSLFNERNVMRQLNHDCRFVVTLNGTFRSNTSAYFLFEACKGGDLFNVLKHRGYLDENTSRFYTASLVEALSYMHSKNIIHRDLKPENIVLDSNGYAKLTDFGFAKQLGHSQKTYTLCGTPGYIAPEIILGQGYGKGSDWFALGCVMFDMLTGQPPFPTRADQFSMIHNMMSNALQLPMYLSFWAKDLLRNLIQLNSMRRFGVVHGGTDKIRNHKWFEHFDWNALRAGTMPAPIKPKFNAAKSMDASNFDCTDLEQMSNELDAQLRTDIVLPDTLKNWDLEF